ncbi:LytTR family transcriptional regulator [Companilactobacillus zhachilii]|jgi:Response regulator of the LytR/AlgR family|uniref:LytTR family transcriptional regulator n=1 Tax=Companilactobacillus zhachilii TaxID=2304606 RepID=A0A386PQ31_9LACO|nr:LytTR family DNA-binding domain-containing protein [Companilactobacillus zhachilii]AYE37272.1 LytTR family transcriptional regulator [Companilactobacillus zhachilii]
MKINFNQDDKIPKHEIDVTIKAANFSDEVQELMRKLEELNAKFSAVPLSVDDRVVMVQIDQIIAIEVLDNELTIYTHERNYQLRGQLKKMAERINDGNFVQISKNTVINLNHLDSLEAAFSGNMTAFLTDDLKFSVSRKYLSDLKKQLGM